MENKVLIFPTDTVYGIGASVYDKKGIDRIYKIKKRDRNKPLAVLCANLNQIEEIGFLTSDARKLIDKFLPGPLTLIIKAKDNIIKSMGIETVGVRIPNYDLALEILNEFGPLATTSVNESGEPSINDYEQIINEYSNCVDKIYSPSNQKIARLASSVLDITSNEIEILRQGAITKEEIERVLNERE